MGALRQHGFALFAALLFAAAVALGIVAGQRWARNATPSALPGPEAGQSGASHTTSAAPEGPEAAITPLAVEPCPLDPGITVYICDQPSRVSWRDGSAGAQGFRVELSYMPSGEQFRYTVPAGVTTFVFPVEALPTQAPCWQRKQLGLQVVALGPAGERRVGQFGVIGECASER